MKTLRKSALLTDIHFGKKANSTVHNEDCLRFLDWFCEQVKNDPEIDHVVFLGDWNENRSSINVATLNYSYQGAKKLNELGLPVYFCVGNHDLYHRHTRELHSIVPFQEFSNFKVIDQPIVDKNVGEGVLFAPYMFHNEYPTLSQYNKIPVWMGHFEFQGFVITGYNQRMLTGPKADQFENVRKIFSGHFHKRQSQGNTHYIGNCFPMDFSDTGDDERGMATYDHVKGKINYINWEDCPKYLRVNLTDLLDETVLIPKHARVKCAVDTAITFEESAFVRQKFLEDFELREFTLEESKEIMSALKNTQTNVVDEDGEFKLDSVDELVTQMLQDINSDHIDNNMLIQIYRDLRIEVK